MIGALALIKLAEWSNEVILLSLFINKSLFLIMQVFIFSDNFLKSLYSILKLSILLLENDLEELCLLLLLLDVFNKFFKSFLNF